MHRILLVSMVATLAVFGCQAPMIGPPTGDKTPGMAIDCNAVCAGVCVDTRVDPNNCGACGKGCAKIENGTSACFEGVCGMGACNEHFSDCNGNAADGREISTYSDPLNCGGCNRACRKPSNGAALCQKGACFLTSCEAGFSDCNKGLADGCEVNVLKDKTNCGACGKVCPAAQVCSKGECVLYADYLVGTACNGTDYGGGCTPAETGYHYKGNFDGYECWWHTKNQAWQTDTATNIYNLAVHFGLDPTSGVQEWCYAFADTPAPGEYSANYNDPDQVGAWGWCGEGPFESGGWTCFTK